MRSRDEYEAMTVEDLCVMAQDLGVADCVGMAKNDLVTILMTNELVTKANEQQTKIDELTTQNEQLQADLQVAQQNLQAAQATFETQREELTTAQETRATELQGQIERLERLYMTVSQPSITNPELVR